MDKYVRMCHAGTSLTMAIESKLAVTFSRTFGLQPWLSSYPARE